MASWYSIRESAPTILRLRRDTSMKENDPAAHCPFRGFTNWSDPHWQRAHGAAQLALHSPVRRDFRSSFRLDALSARTLHHLPYALVAARLAALGFRGEGAEAFWLAVRGNLARLGDVAIWRQVTEGEIAPIVRRHRISARRRLGSHDLGRVDRPAQGTQRTQRSGAVPPLRLALTGRDAGPELAAMLPLMGRTRALARLSAPGG